MSLGVAVLEQAALGDAELLPHQVDPGDLFRDRVLDLQASVHLEERHGSIGADQELAGAGAHVADLLEDGLRCGVQQIVLLLREERCGRLFDELLVTALQRAVARRDHHDVARGVCEALGLDVTRLVEVLLDEALAAAERGDGLAGRRLEQLSDLVELAGDLEPASAAAVCGLDGDGQAELLGERDDLVGRLDRTGGAGGERCADLLGDVTRGHLVAEGLDRLGRRADPGHPRVDDRAGELGVLGEEAVARVHGVGAGSAGDREDLLDLQVGLRARLAAERVRLVGETGVKGVSVLVGVDGDRGDSGVPGGADDADGDLAAVGDEHLGDSRHECQPSEKPLDPLDDSPQERRRIVEQVLRLTRSLAAPRARSM